ncbi:hypothetical protein B0T22DRAFT_536426 [Podospora appendiculata]|uniref:Uncharacterized protein n=1 Tax=Podospora appendiculata TaxID=314037 RepID=A0AAE0XBC6_9PEZI|nr:hypothetical protein B0T22DRAFT_536426 [Podospora appendiculata]
MGNMGSLLASALCRVTTPFGGLTRATRAMSFADVVKQVKSLSWAPMTTRKSSGADIERGNGRMRSTRSSGMSGMFEAVRGDGRMGRVGFVSTRRGWRPGQQCPECRCRYDDERRPEAQSEHPAGCQIGNLKLAD